MTFDICIAFVMSNQNNISISPKIYLFLMAQISKKLFLILKTHHITVSRSVATLLCSRVSELLIPSELRCSIAKQPCTIFPSPIQFLGSTNHQNTLCYKVDSNRFYIRRSCKNYFSMIDLLNNDL